MMRKKKTHHIALSLVLAAAFSLACAATAHALWADLVDANIEFTLRKDVIVRVEGVAVPSLIPEPPFEEIDETERIEAETVPPPESEETTVLEDSGR